MDSNQQSREISLGVVGTGLGSLGATLALVDSGYRPVVIDIGHTLPEQGERKKKAFIAEIEGSRVGAERERTRQRLSAIPKKTVFGSDYFLSPNPNLPPYSEAFGGLSAGWGGAFLMPAEDDVSDWPIDYRSLLTAARRASLHLPLSEPSDQLEAFFPRLSADGSDHLATSRSQSELLTKLSRLNNRVRGVSEVVSGQSRLTTRYSEVADRDYSGCKFCGNCLLGCPYGSIFSADQGFERLAKQGLIDLRLGLRLVEFKEQGGVVNLELEEVRTKNKRRIQLDYLFLGAGAVQSSLIVHKSLSLKTNKIHFSRPGGAILPLFSGSPFPNEWPNSNSQPAAFIEFKAEEVSNHWNHIQLSLANELIAEKLGYPRKLTAKRSDPRRLIFTRMAYALVNFHSESGPRYEVQISDLQNNRELSAQKIFDPQNQVRQRKLMSRSRRLLRKAGFFPLRFFEQSFFSAGSYHIGGSLPMGKNSGNSMATDEMGRPSGSRNVSVVDASVLPSIPGTTVGLAILANAYRIASTTHLETHQESE